MPHSKSRGRKAAFPDREIIAKAEGRFAKADKQRAGMKARSQTGEVARERARSKRAKKDKPSA